MQTVQPPHIDLHVDFPDGVSITLQASGITDVNNTLMASSDNQLTLKAYHLLAQRLEQMMAQLELRATRYTNERIMRQVSAGDGEAQQ
ncbi:hypothetical protein ACXWTF_12700 [Thiomicrolovo sp. ZZH C-3]